MTVGHCFVIGFQLVEHPVEEIAKRLFRLLLPIHLGFGEWPDGKAHIPIWATNMAAIAFGAKWLAPFAILKTACARHLGRDEVDLMELPDGGILFDQLLVLCALKIIGDQSIVITVFDDVWLYVAADLG